MMTKLQAAVTLLVLTIAWAVRASDGMAVAVVADLDGRVLVAPAERPTESTTLVLMQPVSARSVLSLQEESSRATLFYPRRGIAYDLRGAGSFEVSEDEVRARGAAQAPALRRLNEAFRAIRLQRSSLMPASVVMRSTETAELPALVAPLGVVLSGSELVFSWAVPDAGREYRFRLMTEGGDLVYETRTHATQVGLPPGVRLVPGKWYLWGVQSILAGGRRGLAQWREFMLADSKVRELASQLDATLSAATPAERNLRDLLLVQQALREAGRE